MQNQPITKKLLQKMTEKIVREINPRKMVLFGSHAKGTARPDSNLELYNRNQDYTYSRQDLRGFKNLGGLR